MGAAASIAKRDELAVLSAEELGTKISELGEDFAAYKGGFVEKDLTGAKVAIMNKDEQIAALLSIGVTNESHQEQLIAEFEKLQVAEPAHAEPAAAEPVPMHVEEAKTEHHEATEHHTEVHAEAPKTEEAASEAVAHVEEAAHIETAPQEAVAAN